ncbi:MAG TPA: hypothetical protein PK165_00835 [bacterium]|nr:hypothetical protein [bacterium]
MTPVKFEQKEIKQLFLTRTPFALDKWEQCRNSIDIVKLTKTIFALKEKLF